VLLAMSTAGYRPTGGRIASALLSARCGAFSDGGETLVRREQQVFDAGGHVSTPDSYCTRRRVAMAVRSVPLAVARGRPLSFEVC